MTPPAQPSADKPMYVSWKKGDADGMARALGNNQFNPEKVVIYSGSGALDRVPAGKAISRDTYRNVTSNNVSVREDFTREDYDYFRPNARIPTEPHEIMKACGQAYYRIPLVRTVLDMMSDFIVQGMDVCHPVARHELFYKEWFYRVRGKLVSERASNVLYRMGQFIIRRLTALLPSQAVTDFRKGTAADHNYIPLSNPDKMEIPTQYISLNPLGIKIASEELALFLGDSAKQYELELPPNLLRMVKQPRDGHEKELVAQLPTVLVNRIRQGGKTLVLDKDTIQAHHYKKDDWQCWAHPLTYCMLPDLQQLNKLKLADLSALDGAILRVRLWKLGSLDHRIYPTDAIINKLADILLNNAGGASIDMIWGPDIELTESSVDVSKFLGEEKYRPTLNALFQALGIPPSLSGSPSAPGFTNNALSLRTMLDRLQYGRDILVNFWTEEFRRVQLAMGFRDPAYLVFDVNSLTDEVAEKKLLLEMYDRNLVSEEIVQERAGMIPEIERVRRRRERRLREKGKLPPRVGPYAEQADALEKVFAQSGLYPAEQFGEEFAQLKPLPDELQPTPSPTSSPPTKKAKKNNGRPLGQKDQTKRKKKRVRPRIALSASQNLTWASAARVAVAEIIQPAVLAKLNKRTLRELTVEESQNLHQLQFATLCQIQPGEEVTLARVQTALAGDLSIPLPVDQLIKRCLAKQQERDGKPPTLEQQRQTEHLVYSLYHTRSD